MVLAGIYNQAVMRFDNNEDVRCAEYQAPVMRGPFNLSARWAAGFSKLRLAALSYTHKTSLG